MQNKRKKIYFVETSFSKQGQFVGKIVLYRTRDGWRCAGAKSYLVTPQRVARALEAQRLFLAQLEKAK